MKTVAYCNPYVPPEWITAHGIQPSWMRLHATDRRRPVGPGRSICPYAGLMIDEVLSGVHDSAIVLTTTCDQMRFAAAVLESNAEVPIFLMNVPSTWQTAAAQRLYLEELERLGRFLVRLGGQSPSREELAKVMLDYDEARDALRAARSQLSAGQFARALAKLRGNGEATCNIGADAARRTGARLAIVGGPLVEKDHAIFDLIEQAGGQVVLDATEGGERTLPASFDRQRVREDPLAELAWGYFGTIPDAFRRPNDGLYEWLGRELETRNVRGILLRRYVWCDIWHAELARLKQWSPVPVLEIDVCDGDEARARTARGIEALLEMLK